MNHPILDATGPAPGHRRLYRRPTDARRRPARPAPCSDAVISSPRSGAVANPGLNQAEPLSHHERIVADHGRGAEEPGHALAAEEIFVRPAPLGGIGVATAFRTRIVVIDHTDRNYAYLGEFDDGGRLSR